MPTIQQTIKKVNGFAHLPDGWRFGEGSAIAEDKILQAERLLNYAEQKGISRTNGFAQTDGGLLVSFYIDNHTLDLTLESDGSLTIAEDFEDEQIDYVENLEFRDAYDRICQFSENLENVFESFTQTTTTANVEDLKVQLSPRRQRTTASPYSIRTVRQKVEEQSASTYLYTMPNLQECLLSTGTFQ